MPSVRTFHYKWLVVLLVGGGAIYGAYQAYQNSTGSLVSKARAAMETQDYASAQSYLSRILRRHPDHLDALLMESTIEWNSKNLLGAEGNLNRILKQDPQNIEANRLLTRVHLCQCKFEEARDRILQMSRGAQPLTEDRGPLALALAGIAVGATNNAELLSQVESFILSARRGGQPDPVTNLAAAILLMERGDYGTALQECRAAQIHLPDWFATRWALGKALFYTGVIDQSLLELDFADQQRRAGRGLTPPGAWATELYLYQGLGLMEKGQLEEAQRRFAFALENSPRSMDPVLAVLNLYLIQASTPAPKGLEEDRELRNYRLAVDTLTRKEEILEEQPVVRYQLALIHIYLQNYREALEILEALTTDAEPYLQAFRELGDLYYRRSNYNNAIDMYRRFLAAYPESLADNYNLGTILIRNHELAEGVNHLRQVVDQAPGNLAARLNLALANRLEQRYTEAEAEYQSILQKNQQNMDALIGLGLIASAKDETEVSNQYFAQARDAFPEADEPYYYLGQLALDAGRDTEAQSMFERCLALNPDNEFAAMAMVELQFRRANWDQARERLERILENPNAWMKVVAENGLALVETMSGNFEAAQIRIQKLEEISAGLGAELTAAVRTNQAILANSEEKNEDALAYSKLAIDAAPSDPIAYYNLGTLQLDAGQYSEAIQSFRQAQNFDPKNEDIQYNLAVAQASVKRWDEALQILRRLTEEENARIEVIRSLADAYIGADQPQEALEILEPALVRLPGLPALLTLKVKSQIALGEIEEARRGAEVLAQSYPQDWEVHFVSGLAAFAAADFQVGETHLRKALQIQPEDPTLMVNLATLLIAKGDYEDFDEAEEILDALVGSGINTVTLFNQRALLAIRRSDYPAARELIEQSIAADRGQEDMQALLRQIEEL
jgi:tetratricopeptide (TPR) repeat protein